MIQSPTVIAVDDRADELQTIVSTLRRLDVACLPILAAGAKVDIKGPLRGVRLVFFDINYLPSITSEIALFEMAATILTKVIAPDNGPYVLITWSSMADQHQKLMAHFADHVEDIPAPAISGTLHKERFTADGAAKDGGEDLRASIAAIISGHPQVEALMQWETSARRAAGEVVGSLLEMFSRKDRFTGKIADELHGTLLHVAESAVGKANVASDRLGAVHEALVPIILDRLVHGAREDGVDDLWARAVTLKPGAPQAATGHGPSLNALSYIARPDSGPMAAGDRGVVFKLPGDVGDLMAKRAGLELQRLAADYVENNKAGTIGPPDMKDLAARCRWVFLGVRATCDQAQGKGTMRPLVLALEVPGDLKDSGLGLKLRRHDARQISPVFITSFGAAAAQQRKLLINWHWTTSMSPLELGDAEVLYRVREPLMALISSHMGGYAARPGIIEF